MRPIVPLPSWQADADARLSEAESRVLLAQINADAQYRRRQQAGSLQRQTHNARTTAEL